MKEEEEKREEAEADKLEETEYEDTLENSDQVINPNPSIANDVEVNYENGNVAVEFERQTESEDTPSGDDVTGNEETPESKTHLPADAPWLSRMFEGNASGPTELCVCVGARMPHSLPFFDQCWFFQYLPRFGPLDSLHLGDPQRTWPFSGTDSWTRAIG
jgi:hypothetical protein